MKTSFKIILILTIITIVGCQQTIKIDNEVTIFHRHATNGIYLKIPKEFIKMERAGLFQSGIEASISTKLSSESFDNLLKLYADGIEFKKVEIDKFEKAFYAKALNKKNKTINYALALNRNDSTFLVKAFCPVNLEEKYDEKIIQSIQSIAFGPELNQEIFLKAKDHWDRKVFTKDGNYPTETIDKATIEKYKMGGLSQQALLEGNGKQVFNNLFDTNELELNCLEVNKSEFFDGNSFECIIEKKGIYYFISMIFDLANENEATIYYCHGNQQYNIGEFKSFISKISYSF